MLPFSSSILNHYSKHCCLLLTGIIITLPLFAHNINYVLQHAPSTDVIWNYLKLGITHIIPYGLDHILFITSLCLLNAKFKTILWQATAFTVAHTITLTLSVQNIYVMPGAIVEPIIALSIAFVALENLLLQDLKPWRVILVFLFGLIHGMGFASALNETGLPPNRVSLSIASFNIGVEIGQFIVIAMVFALLIIPFRNNIRFKKVVVYPLSVCIALIATYWMIERIFT
ncbi:HupE/UreJ family protein [Chitinophagaceae bacterium LB-8]|uniref:HupE/UreJ family protein n=1 Tax=Paraflavisolibacter caeni TaxID=2982496 RepID=A0A9X3B8D5_9BACT|nr:HupE/UreJ family protein [Paraflavisolibacter caeni]MCU7549621.1 HupE/UreJ family protein [Paraflavisolibacter caeni]